MLFISSAFPVIFIPWRRKNSFSDSCKQWSIEHLELFQFCGSPNACIAIGCWLSQRRVGPDLQVLAESEQMRREADNIGPRVELEHWKMRTAKFNYICEQIKSKPFKAVIGVLHVAKSKLLTVIVL